VTRAVFLDRDGVVNRALVRAGKPYPPASLEELEIVPGAREALGRLKDRGFALVVVTNQPDVARGTATRATVEALNARIGAELPIDEFRVCYHDSGDGCDCRKPRPGMIVDAARERGIDRGASYMIGDRWRDIEAGEAAGCTTIFIDYGYDERRPEGSDHVVRSLDEAVAIILDKGETSEVR
jgi:D-glycero-D-manno-heptose 1,7-bisphosphate phosphatase